MFNEQTSEDERIKAELSSLRMKFPNKKFQLVGESGSKKIEVVLDW
jgi:phosphatidate phosphatase APP1